ncbi:hypothetical protein ANO14919_050490 [Xylariales sp. No.14919]|nr:hypothetical protein ANO14919_050490 [Xylariales sp. No.14919]
MLCQTCDKAIQAAIRRHSLYLGGPKIEQGPFFGSLLVEPLHLSLDGFYQSARGGCLVCRWTWEKLSNPPQHDDFDNERPPEKTPIFLGDPGNSVPSSLEDFRNKFVEFAKRSSDWPWGSEPHRLGGYTVTKVISRAIFRASQHLILWCHRHNIRIPRFHALLVAFLACQTGSGMHIELEPDMKNAKGHYEVLVGFGGNNRLRKLEMWPASDDIPEIINSLDLKIRRASTADAPKLWHRWFTTCLNDHTDCQSHQATSSKAFRPTRLIQLLQDDQGEMSAWRLDCGTTAVRYLTLSHCWGSSKHMKLTKRNIHEFQQPSPVSGLQKTYRDALSIAQSLGIHHIWIDSLCIIQREGKDDDDEDWKKESREMDKIYGHADCNIAASWAKDGTEGCFSSSDPAARTPTLISTNLPGLDSPVRYLIGQAHTYKEELDEAPLNKRGWVVQERYLARRQLSFAKRQVYWECCQLVASEEFPAGVPPIPGLSKPHLQFGKGTDIRKIWAGLVNLYSHCGLTVKSDKLVAIRGLTNKLENIADDDVYIFGLWANDLWQQMLWQPRLISWNTSSAEYSQTRIPDHEAPTWSWASSDGPVMFDEIYGDVDAIRGCTPWVRVGKSSCANELVLRGIAIWGHVHTIGINASRGRGNIKSIDVAVSQVLSPTGYMAVHITWDEFLASSEAGSDRFSALEADHDSKLLCMVIRHEDHWKGPSRHGVLLRRSGFTKDKKAAYKRVGLWRTYDTSSMFDEFLLPRLGLSSSRDFNIETHLDNPEIAGWVHEVTIV